MHWHSGHMWVRCKCKRNCGVFFFFGLLVSLCSHERAFRIAQHPRPLLAHYETYHRQHRKHRSICAYNVKHTHARSRDVTLGNHFNHLCAYNVHYACTCAVFSVVLPGAWLTMKPAMSSQTHTHTHSSSRRDATQSLRFLEYGVHHTLFHITAQSLACVRSARARVLANCLVENLFVRAAWQLLLTFIDFEKTNLWINKYNYIPLICLT